MTFSLLLLLLLVLAAAAAAAPRLQALVCGEHKAAGECREKSSKKASLVLYH